MAPNTRGTWEPSITCIDIPVGLPIEDLFSWLEGGEGATQDPSCHRAATVIG